MHKKIKKLTKRVRRKIYQTCKRLSAKSLILMYHRVAEEEIDPWALCVSSQNFAEQMEVLQKVTHPISLRQFVQAYKVGKVLNRSVVVTFDDGYFDNLHNAKPLLEKYDVPATLFITQGYIGSEREFWWDELERIFLHPGDLPKSLTLDIIGKTFQRDLGEYSNYDLEKYKKFQDWIVYSDKNSCLRQDIYLELHQILQPLAQSEQRRVLNDLLVWSGMDTIHRPTRRSLTPEELLQLNQGELIEIGSHSITHPSLSTLSEPQQKEEILQSKTALEEFLGEPVRSFAYPYGNYSSESIKFVREAGYTCACSAVNDSVWRGSHPFQLSRITVNNLNGEEFYELLSKSF